MGGALETGSGVRGPRLGRSWEKRPGTGLAGADGVLRRGVEQGLAWNGHLETWMTVAKSGGARRELGVRDWVGEGRGDGS